MDAKKEEQERFKAYEEYAKSREKHEEDFIENLKDQLDVSKQINNSYKGIVDKLGEQKSELSMAKKMQKTIQDEIVKNESKISVLNDIKEKRTAKIAAINREILSNNEDIRSIDSELIRFGLEKRSITDKIL